MQSSDERVYVEVGAGKGYLSSMLANSFRVKKLLMVDSGTFRLKADRSVSQQGVK